MKIRFPLLFLLLLNGAMAAVNVPVQVNDTTGVLWRPTAFSTFLVPSQAGHAGQFLTTDGTTASWATVSGGGGGSNIFTASDFNESGSTVSIDYTNGQKATSLIPGFLTAADWTTFNAKAPTASPTFTGTPIAPTAAADTSTTQLATTAFVIGQAYLKASTAATTYQGLDSDLTSIAALATTSFGRSLLTESSASTLRTTLSLVPGTNFLALPTGTPNGSKYLRDDNTWQPIVGGGDALTTSPLSQFAATTSAQLASVLSDDVGSSGGFVRSGYLGTAAVEAASAFQPADADLTTYANITPSANVQSLLGAANYSAMRTQLSLVPGTDVQAYDADLATYAGITPSANIQTFLGAANYAAMRTQLGLVISTDVQAYDSDLTAWGALSPSSNPLLLYPNASMGALSVDVTKRNNTKSVSTDSTLTFSATASAGATFGLTLTNSDSASHTITIPSSYSLALAATSTSFTIPASTTVEISWRYDGTTYYLAGESRNIADLTSVTVATGDKVALNDVSAGTDGQATVASILALGISDTAYSSSFNGVTTVAPTKNAIYDYLHIGDTDDDGLADKLDLGTAGVVRTTSGGVISSSELSGDATTSGSNAVTLATVNSNVGTYGNATTVPAVTVNAKGLVTGVSNVTISAGASAPTIAAKTADYTLALADAGNIVTGTSGSTVTFTIPPQSSVTFTGNEVITVGQLGAGSLVIDPGSGVTVNGGTANLTLSGQYEFATLVRTASDTWMLNYAPATGTGNYVKASSPTLVTPTIGAATATSINGVTISGGTNAFTIGNGTTSANISGGFAGNIVLAGTGNVTMPEIEAKVGFRGIPWVVANANATTNATSNGKGWIGDVIGNNTTTYTINRTQATTDAANGGWAWSVFHGTAGGNVITVTASSGNIVLAGSGNLTGGPSAVIASGGLATFTLANTTLIVSGSNVTVP